MPRQFKVFNSIRLNAGASAITNHGRDEVIILQVGEGGPTPGLLNLTTTSETISLSELTTPGMCYIKNLDDTASVRWGNEKSGGSSFQPLGLLAPGETALFRLDPTISAFLIRTVTGTAKVEVLIWEA